MAYACVMTERYGSSVAKAPKNVIRAAQRVVDALLENPLDQLMLKKFLPLTGVTAPTLIRVRIADQWRLVIHVCHERQLVVLAAIAKRSDDTYDRAALAGLQEDVRAALVPPPETPELFPTNEP